MRIFKKVKPYEIFNLRPQSKFAVILKILVYTINIYSLNTLRIIEAMIDFGHQENNVRLKVKKKINFKYFL